jgi:hypothetical protein
MSHHAYDEALKLRQAMDDDAAAADSTPPPVPAGAPCLAVQTKTVTTYPTAAARYFACKSLQITGTETEGSTGTVGAGSDTVYVLNLGTAIPPSGTNVLATFVDYRWVFRYDG